MTFGGGETDDSQGSYRAAGASAADDESKAAGL
jgi:hypothetical protein